MPAEIRHPPYDHLPDQPSNHSDALEITLLGGFRVVVAGRAIAADDWPPRRAGDLVKLLALAPGHRLHAEQAMETLWPEAASETAARNLQQALHRARRVLEPELQHGSASRYLRRTPEDILCLVAPGGLTIDADAFRAARAAARRSGALADLAAAAARYPGDLLPQDAYADWTIRPREVLRETYIALLLELAGRYEQDGQFAEVSATLLRLVEADAAHEEARLALMRLYARQGRRYDALRQYQQLRQALRRELDADPSPTTQRLYDAIRAGTFAADLAAAPGSSGDRWADPTPQASASPGAGESGSPPLVGEGLGERFATSFIGRAREIADLSRLLETERLVTLRGVGGSGKTRLAARVASERRDVYPGGVAWVELAPLADGRLVAPTVAAALGVREETGRPLIETLAHEIGDRDMLLVLDNCEHLVAAAAALAAALLASCPRLRLLATSRRPLHVAGECAWRVPAMTAPDPDDLPPFAQLGEYDAIRLFVARAAERRPGFALTPRNASAVVDIGARLDGIPLAIELAAARLRLLSADEVAARLDDALALLADGDDTKPLRQRTLRAVLDWSHALLAADERVLFRRLAVFAGGWALDAVEAVCAGDGSDGLDGIAPGQVLDLLERLADASLVVVEEQGGQTRHRLLEMVRRYALEQLDASGEREAISRRHAEWCAALAEQAASLLYDRGQDVWRARQMAERDNARAALRWAKQRQELAIGLRLVGALRRFWYLNNFLGEGRRWLEDLLGDADDGVRIDPAVLGMAHYSAGLLAGYQGDFAVQEAHAARALAIYQVAGDLSGAADAYNMLGDAAFDQGRYDQAIAYQNHYRARAEAANDPYRVAMAISNLADVAAAQGNITHAVELYMDCLARARHLNNWRMITIALVNLGKMAARQGDPARATALLEEALALHHELGERRGEAEVLVPLGALAREGGDNALAHTRYIAALTLYAEAGNRLGVAQALEGLALTAQQQHDPMRAARLLGAGSALRELLGTPLPPDRAPEIAQATAALRTALGPRAFTEAWTRGGVAPLDRIIAEATAAPAHTPASPTTPARPARSAAPTPTALTRRERDVAALVARGCTDRQIGETLKMAERTASKHVANILAKRHLASRAAIAAWWRAHEPHDP